MINRKNRKNKAAFSDKNSAVKLQYKLAMAIIGVVVITGATRMGKTVNGSFDCAGTIMANAQSATTHSNDAFAKCQDQKSKEKISASYKASLLERLQK